MELLRNMWNDGAVGKAVTVATAALLLGIPVGLYGIAQEEKQWEVFKVEKACKKVGHMAGNNQSGIGYGVTPSGQLGTVFISTSSPDKTGWSCNDGVTYWR